MNKNKKILVIVINGDSSLTGFAVRVIAVTRSLMKNGYDATILRFYPIVRSQGKWHDDESLSDLNIIEVPVFPLAKFAILRWLSFNFANALIYGIAKINNIAFIQAESHDSGLVTLMRKWFSIPVIVDFHGAAPEELLSLNLSNGQHNKKHDWLEVAERVCINKATAIFCVSEKMLEHLRKKHDPLTINNSYLVPIGVETCFFAKASRIEIRQQLGVLDNEVLFVYSGGAQEYQCIQEMADIFSKLHKTASHYKLLVITRNIDEFKRVFATIAPDCTNIIYKSVNREDVPALLSAADVGFLLRKNEILNIVSCPTKFGEYLACGLPVITTQWAGHAAALVDTYGFGIVLDIDNVDFDRIRFFSDNITEKMRAHCVMIAQSEMTWEKSEAEIMRCYADIDNA